MRRSTTGVWAMSPVHRVLTAVALAVAAAVCSVSAAAAQEKLIVLDKTSALPGTDVKAEVSDLPSDCVTFSVHWADPNGDVLKTDLGIDGKGTVTFKVPDDPPQMYTVYGTCTDARGEEKAVAKAQFLVTAASPTVPPTTAAPSTTAPQSTTRPPGRPTTTRPGSTTAPTSGGPNAPTTSAPTVTVDGAAPPPPRPVPRDISDCEQMARQAESQLVYQPDRRMTFGNSYDVVAVLALDSTDAGAVALPGPDRTTIVTVGGTRCTVEAELTGPDFEITPPGPHAQSFLDSRVLTWRWQVAPKRTGTDLKLLLRIQPTVVEDGKAPRPGNPGFHDAVIEVESQPQSLISKVNRGVSGIFGHQLVQYLLIPSGGGVLTLWLWSRLRRRGSDDDGGAAA